MNSNLISSPHPISSPSVIPASLPVIPANLGSEALAKEAAGIQSSLCHPEPQAKDLGFPRDLRAEWDAAVAQHGRAKVLAYIVNYFELSLSYMSNRS